MVSTNLNSNYVSRLIYLPKIDEPSLQKFPYSHSQIVFIGNSYTYSIPVFINFDRLLNPHILIVGMTGSGKTFLMKSLILRLSLLEETKIILVDFTGEYQNPLNLLPIKEINTEELHKKEILYFNLAGVPEQDKITTSSELLEKCVTLMRNQETDSKKRIFIVLDEAWKLLRTEKSLETIVREGRKYGVGFILSSQLIEDTDTPILSNIATIFLFRTQNKKSLEKISKNYNLSEAQTFMARDLELGSCLMIQSHKSGLKSAFVIRKVIGLSFNATLKIKLGNDMGIEIELNEFEKLISRLCSDKSADIIRQAKERNEIQLNCLIKELLVAGSDRREILLSFRKLGFDDATIADSFSYAISECDIK